MRLTIFAPAHLLDGLSACLFEAGAGGLEEGPSRLIVYADSGAELEKLHAAAQDFASRIEEYEPGAEFEFHIDAPDDSWQSTWQAALGPVKITSTWTLRPTHCQPAPKKEKTLWFKAEAAFGSGDHATTQLAAEYVESFVREHHISEVFDVGTGTGVLAMVAAKAGAAEILAVDTDQISVNAARHNVELNQLSSQITVESGSADFSERKFPLVVANINTHILVEIAGALAAALSEKSTLVLTGLLDDDIAQLTGEFLRHGVKLSHHTSRDGWALVRGSKV